MDTRYKIIISNKRIYKEVELSNEMNIVKIGTTKNCEVRFAKELFFSEYEIICERIDNSWNISCEDSIYISSDGVRKLPSQKLSHGDEIFIKYQESNQELFKISFMLNFDVEKKDYDRIIDIFGSTQINFGRDGNNDICLNDSLLGSDIITLNFKDGKYFIVDNNTKYGVYRNGIKIKHSAELFDYDFFTIVGYSFYFKYGKLYTSKSSNLILNVLKWVEVVDQKSHLQYPKFNRNTRAQHILPEDVIEIQQPQTKPQKPKKNIAISLIPAISMLGLMVVLRGSMGSGGTFVIYSACSMSIGIIMSVVSFINDGKQYKKDIAERERLYMKYINNKEKKIIALRSNELRIRQDIHESLENSIEEVRNFGGRLFEKDYNDKDFLDVYLGNGEVEANCKVKYTNQEFVDMDDPVSQLPEQMEEKYRYINSAPIISGFAQSCGVGVVGNRDKLYDVMKNMTLDLAIRHFYKDIKMFYIFDIADEEKLQWIRWLKHVYNDELNIRNFMCDEESKNVLFEFLYGVLSKRETDKKAHEDSVFFIQYVIFILDSKDIEKHPVSKYFESAKEYGFTFIFFEEYEELLPKGCTEIIRLSDSDDTGIMLQSLDSDRQSKFAYNTVNDVVAEEVALKLGAVYVDEVSLESELTKNITIFELLNIMSIDDMDLNERWNKSRVYKSMAVPLGVKRKNEVVYLDISDKSNAHGPHGLVAGTTGSGKSEILQSYILSMASLFHPYDVGFVIIDFKGGGMANQFKDLPHLMGAITNIDGREINRSLLSIKAELIHRQELFSQSGVNHINDYIQLYKKGEVSQPLPHLIIIVDEFAELKSEYPEFMKEIISASRIGRTLGIHLILATQKPSGVVDNQIWSNSKFKLCLKVQTKEDSNEVIKTPLASEIVEPGRAYFQVGNNEIFELFQSAYSGAKVTEGNDNTKVYSIYSLNTWGKREIIYTNKIKSQSNDAKNQLEVMVDYINGYCINENIDRLNGICLPPLRDIIFCDELETINKELVEGIRIAIGIYDDPEQQRQESYVLNLSESNTYIIGSAQTGKTTLLQTIIYEIMNNYLPSEVNLYIIDCGNRALKVFEESRHVGGVALTLDEEKVQNLFKMISNTISKRKDVFSTKGLGTYKAYVEAGFKDMPQILIFIDNISVFREHFTKSEDDFLNFSREGQSVGINFIITGSQTNSIGFRALANCGNRIAYNCNDKGEYSNLFDRCRMQPKELHGRGLCVIDKKILEFQTSMAFEGEKEIIRVENMKKFIKANASNIKEEKAKEIPEVPQIIKYSDLLESHNELFMQPYKIPYGIDYATVDYRFIDLLKVTLLAISGKEQSGKTNFIIHIMKQINKNIFANITETYIIDSEELELEIISEFGFVKEYTTNATSIGFIIDTIYEQLERRQALVLENRSMQVEEVLKDEPLLLLLIENNSVLTELAKDKQLQTKVNTIIKQYKKLKVAIIFTNIENSAIQFNSAEMLKVIKENKKLILFEDIENIKVCDITIKQLKQFNKPLKIGDTYVYINGEVSKVKTILND